MLVSMPPRRFITDITTNGGLHKRRAPLAVDVRTVQPNCFTRWLASSQQARTTVVVVAITRIFLRSAIGMAIF